MCSLPRHLEDLLPTNPAGTREISQREDGCVPELWHAPRARAGVCAALCGWRVRSAEVCPEVTSLAASPGLPHPRARLAPSLVPLASQQLVSQVT